ncbi:MAG: topoisomerase type subunit region 2 domain protein [Verrucomicrobiales bacterium]|nr:topoisomerase type subunit region 2 domain protein [Verrucomicrobiales bacterium]
MQDTREIPGARIPRFSGRISGLHPMDEIQRLSPLEAIRHRPELYVRPDEPDTVPDQLLQASLCHPLAELQCGSASRLHISISGLSAVITDDGPGWPVHRIHDGRRFAESLLGDLYACRDHKQHAELAKSLCRITLPVVVALSECFTLDILRDGEHWRQVYRNGNAEAPLSCIGSCRTSGTRLSFVLDQRFCDGAVFSAEALSVWLAALPPEVPGDGITVHAS